MAPCSQGAPSLATLLFEEEPFLSRKILVLKELFGPGAASRSCQALAVAARARRRTCEQDRRGTRLRGFKVRVWGLGFRG